MVTMDFAFLSTIYRHPSDLPQGTQTIQIPVELRQKLVNLAGNMSARRPDVPLFIFPGTTSL